ncbi:hypothetical protein BDV36DRAFT_248510 [Aspergillus pseudocaelatus]|uniref:Copper transporter n=1 Tax=Aspergillus pseudocaelatus TaxID=1825620 RepID=A0ABQ6WX54_9EURO|nr:hypothetical protein BDV36DRAFT_248510 [Aspergillus pseudocaelatus]
MNGLHFIGNELSRSWQAFLWERPMCRMPFSSILTLTASLLLIRENSIYIAAVVILVTRLQLRFAAVFHSSGPWRCMSWVQTLQMSHSKPLA